MYRNLEKILRERNISNYKLTKDLGFNTSFLTDWKKGKSQPKIDKLTKIANYLDIPLNLISDIGDQDSQYNIMKTSVPVYGVISAGIPFEAIQNIIGEIDVPNRFIGKDTFALKVSGDSMDKIIPSGAIALFEKTCELCNGEIGAVMVGNEDATIKRFFKLTDKVVLEPCSHNEKNQPIIVGEVKIIGKLLWVCIEEF